MHANVRFEHQLLAVESEHTVKCMLELQAPPAPEGQPARVRRPRARPERADHVPSRNAQLGVAFADFERLTGPTVADIAVARSA